MDINIRAIKLEDFETIVIWSKDEKFCEANDWQQNRDAEELYSWWVNCVTNPPNDFIRLGIEYQHQLVGYGDLARINGSTAELGIAIGDSSLWGHGIGVHAAEQIITYASSKLGITMLEAETHETNLRAIKLLEKVGFNEISRLGTELYLGKETQLLQFSR